MPKNTARALSELLHRENTLLKSLLEAKRVTKEDLRRIKELQEEKKKLIEKLLRLDREAVLSIWDDIKRLTVENIKNKELLLSLIQLYASKA